MKKEAKDLFNVYGARLSKAGDRVNVSLVKGEDEKREWATISLKLESKGKVKATIKDGFAFVKIPLLEEKEEEIAIEDIPF